MLHGLVVAVPGDAPSERVAAATLSALGATIARDSLEPDRAHVEIGGTNSSSLSVSIDDSGSRDLAGLPDGTYDVAAGYCLALGALIAIASGESVEILGDGVVAHLLLPELMASTYRSDYLPRPSSPIPAPGGGMVSAELTDDDAEIFALLLRTATRRLSSETLSAEAQAWRLPVLPYRHPPARQVLDSSPLLSRTRHRRGEIAWRRLIEETSRSKPLSGSTVVDLTTMWAGPLATWFLASLGATVVKIEPDCRLDGYRAVDGMGVHPAGCVAEERHSGDQSALFNALNQNKTRRPLDLRLSDQRQEFLGLVHQADLVIDNLSPRARRQLDIGGLIEASTSRPAELSIVAFPPGGPVSEWTGYGSGVHAFSGLGSWEDEFYAPSVSYPDPLTGMLVALKAVAALLKRKMTGHPPHRLVQSLLESVKPLQGMQVNGQISRAVDPDRGPRVHASQRLRVSGFFRRFSSSTDPHDYPGPPFNPETLFEQPTPAPARDSS